MEREKIRQEFIREAEKLIDSRRQVIESASGTARLEAMHNHLEAFDEFVVLINHKLNDILDIHNIVFESEKHHDEFTAYITPAFTELFKKYYQLSRK